MNAAVRTRPMRVAIYGEFGRGNFGNDASLLAAVDKLRVYDPQIEISCLCSAPEAVRARYGLPATGIRHTPPKERSRPRSPLVRVARRFSDAFRMYRLMRRIDAVMVPGMGVMEAGPARAGATPSELLMTAAAARAGRTRFALVSIGAGSTYRRSTRAVLRWTLRLAHYRSFRDDYSRDYAVAFGAPCESDPVFPDLVFGLGPQDDPASRTPNGTVGVGLIAYRGAFYGENPARRDAIAATYEDSITSFVQWLIQRGLRVVLLTGDRKDMKVAEEIRERLSHDTSATELSIRHAESQSELMAHMREVDLVVVSRYHNLIGAALLAKPVISIDYKPKNGELMANMGLGRFHQPLEHLDEDLLRSQFLDLQRSADEVAKTLAAATLEYRDLTDRQWSVLRRSVLEKPPERIRGHRR